MIAASYRRYIGTAIALIVYGSELGVMIAANRKIRKIAYRRFLDSHCGETIPMSSRNTSRIGNRNDRPNANATSITKDTYRSNVSTDTTPGPANPSRKLRARGSV